MKLLSIGPLSTRQFLAKYFPKVFEANGDRTRVSWFTIQDNRDSGSMPVGPRAFSENISANKCRVDNWPIFLRYLNIVSWWIYKGKLVNLSFNGSDLKTFLRKIINSLMFLDHSHIISSLENQFFFLKFDCAETAPESLEKSKHCSAGLETSRNCPAGLGTSRNWPIGLGLRFIQKLPRRVRKRPETAPQG